MITFQKPAALFLLLVTLMSSAGLAGRTGGGIGSGSRSSSSGSSYRAPSRSTGSGSTYRDPSRPSSAGSTYRAPSYRARDYRTPTYTTPGYRTAPPVVIVTQPATLPGVVVTQPYRSDVGSAGMQGYAVSRGPSPLLWILPLLLIAGIAGFLLWRRSQSSLQSGASAGPGGRHAAQALSAQALAAQALSVQLLISGGEEIKSALQKLAADSDPDSQAGLVKIIGEAALLALRHQSSWSFGKVSVTPGSEEAADIECGQVATLARSAFEQQTTSNYRGDDPGSQRQTQQVTPTPLGQYLALTLAVAVRENLPFTGGERALLLRLSSLSEDALIRAEVVWSPDQDGELLTEDEAVLLYPDLKPV